MASETIVLCMAALSPANHRYRMTVFTRSWSNGFSTYFLTGQRQPSTDTDDDSSEDKVAEIFLQELPALVALFVIVISGRARWPSTPPAVEADNEMLNSDSCSCDIADVPLRSEPIKSHPPPVHTEDNVVDRRFKEDIRVAKLESQLNLIMLRAHCDIRNPLIILHLNAKQLIGKHC